MDSRLLQHVYQAWIQGNNDHMGHWYTFAEWAASQHNISIEEVLALLKNCSWAEM